jgi:hypothetical protein
MFKWYRDAAVCIAYLGDYDVGDPSLDDECNFSGSKWMKRGWTLQELIAPNDVMFYDRSWRFIGTRADMAGRISSITRVSEQVLVKRSENVISAFSVSERLSWAVERQTTRPEDRIYSLLGIFNVNMPILYGEGQRSAFFRLQVEVF